MTKKKSTTPKKKYKTKPRKQTDTSEVTFFNIRVYLFIFFFTILFLFYPGSSLYTRLFAFNSELFESAFANPSTNFTPTDIPYVRQGTADPVVSAQGVYVIDLATATPVFARNERQELFPASTTKVITALTAYDVFELDDVLTVERVEDEGQSMGLVQGERLTFESLLYGALVHSGNDAAYTIADNYPGGYSAFIDAMNRKAESLGMSNSQFQNPAGLDSFLQRTSAYDLSLAGRELLQNKELAKIVSTKSITVSDVDYTIFHPLFNVNRLLGEIPGVAGLKTGKTDLAGENLITLYKKGDKEFLLVILKSADRFTDTSTLVGWIDANVLYQEI